MGSKASCPESGRARRRAACGSIFARPTRSAWEPWRWTPYGVLITGLVEGKVDDLRLDRLVQRIKKSPAQLFYEIGDDLADALDSMSRMSDEDFNEMVSLESVTGWLRYLVTGKLPGE